ncbi:MAG: signal peptidase I [Rickettsiales bacterium]|jgi:signal peptidase I|nr:signal peptidase I [Rickettsiales bacterium]
MAKKNKAREWFDTIVWGGLIAIAFRSFLLEPFNIPSGSMIPTLQVGDHIFVQKWDYGYSRNSFPFGSWRMWDGRFLTRGHDAQVGDVVVFRKPDSTLDYVKRLVARGGDTVQMIGGRLHINGRQIERKNPRPYIIANISRDLRSAGWSQVDGDGTITLIKNNQVFINNQPADFGYTIEYKSSGTCRGNPYECFVIRGTEWTEVLPNGKEHSIVEINDNSQYDNTPLIKVPEGQYFFMGDDRDLSSDSRAWGFVPRDNLLGRVWFVWYSHNYYSPLLAVWNWGPKMRWTRFGMGIN